MYYPHFTLHCARKYKTKYLLKLMKLYQLQTLQEMHYTV